MPPSPINLTDSCVSAPELIKQKAGDPFLGTEYRTLPTRKPAFSVSHHLKIRLKIH
jgi:hypothetical protein